jgi:hypothetical protein
MSRASTSTDGHVFVAVDRCTCECVGLHAARGGDRFEAMAPLRQGAAALQWLRGEGTCGLRIRHDH